MCLSASWTERKAASEVPSVNIELAAFVPPRADGAAALAKQDLRLPGISRQCRLQGTEASSHLDELRAQTLR